jgi:hypothetical protein
VSNYEDYYYKIAAVTSSNEYYYHEIKHGSPRPIYRLRLVSDGSLSDYTDIGFSPFASDGVDNSPLNYDVIRTDTNTHQIAAYQANWVNNSVTGVRLRREIKAEIDRTTEFKSFVIRLRSTATNLTVSLENGFRTSEKVIFYDPDNPANATNLMNGSHQFTVSNSDYKNYRVLIGNVQPEITFTNREFLSEKMYRGGDAFNIAFSSTFRFLLDHIEVSLISETDSLLINDNVAYNATSVLYSLPSDVNMNLAHLVMDAYCTDGEIVRFKSDWTVTIVPSTYDLSINSGINYFSNPFTDDHFPDFDYSGFYVSGNDWNPVTNSLDYGKGYFLSLPDVFETNIVTNPIKKTQQDFTLQAGWNLVPNPHIRDFDIKDLYFKYNDVEYQYSDLIAYNILPPYVRVIRNKQEVFSENVNAFESFLLYANINSGDDFEILFKLNQNNKKVTLNPNITWQGSLRVEYVDDPTNNDEIIVSTSEDFYKSHNSLLYHLPKFLKQNDNIEFSLSSSQMLKTVRTLSKTEPDFENLAFNISLPELSKLKFKFTSLIAKERQQMVLEIGSTSIPFWPGEIIEYMPETTEISGNIKLVNSMLMPENEIVLKKVDINVYPNPFNPITNIAFSLDKRSVVDISIFNIKGQKVKQIANRMLDPGNHVLQWNGLDTNNKSVSSGIYFILLNINGDKRTVRKVTLMK